MIVFDSYSLWLIGIPEDILLRKSIVSESFAFFFPKTCTGRSKGSRIWFPFHISEQISIIWSWINFAIFTNNHLDEEYRDQGKIHLKFNLKKRNTIFIPYWFYARVIQNTRVLEKTQIWQKLRCDWKVLVERPIYIWSKQNIFANSTFGSHIQVESYRQSSVDSNESKKKIS